MYGWTCIGVSFVTLSNGAPRDRHAANGPSQGPHSGGGRCGGGVEVEPRAPEVAAQSHHPRVHHVDDGGDHLRLRGGVLGHGGYQLEQRDVLRHGRSLPSAGRRSNGVNVVRAAPGGPVHAHWWSPATSNTVPVVEARRSLEIS